VVEFDLQVVGSGRMAEVEEATTESGPMVSDIRADAVLLIYGRTRRCDQRLQRSCLH